MGFTSFRIGHAATLNHHKTPKPPHARRDGDATPNPSCNTGGFYTSPQNGATVSSMAPLTVTWDSTCLATAMADIYLFSPASNNARIHVWQAVPFAQGSYTATLMPRWWNSTASQSLQLAIVPAGQPPFLATLPAGPVFSATYSAPTDGSPVPPAADTTQFDSGITIVSSTTDSSTAQHHLTPGKTAAAVILPLLFLGLIIGVYLKYVRRKTQVRTKRFSQALDKRMSTMSADWKSITPAGASAAIRSSMAVGRESSAFDRESKAFGFGAIRPMSTVEAGVGSAAGSYNVANQQMSQVRTGTGVGLRGPVASGDRVSRVSFAADTRVSRVSFADTVGRPSGESRRTRAFHSAYVPPLPTAQADTRTAVVSMASMYPDSVMPVEDGGSEESTVVGSKIGSPKSDTAPLSPRQAQGPLTLTPEDIRARIQGRKGATAETNTANANNRSEEMDEVMPALSMMRTGLSQQSADHPTDEYLFTTLPSAPTPTHPKPTASSPISPGMYTAATYGGSPYEGSSGMASPISPLPGATMSPDDMMKAYATRKAAAAAAAGGNGRASPAPSGAPGAFAKAKVVGRKLSLNFGGKKEREGKERPVIGYPVMTSPSPAVNSPMIGAGMAGVGVGAGMAGVGAGAAASYAIGEDEDEDTESAYIGTAN